MAWITVLSLFDGMSCGRLALERAGIKVNNYFASEIDKHAIRVTQHNFPDTIQLGDVNKVNIKTKIMSCWTKPELENMLEDVVNELDLSEIMIEKHGPLGTAPAELVRLVLEQKDKEIRMLKAGMVEIERT